MRNIIMHVSRRNNEFYCSQKVDDSFLKTWLKTPAYVSNYIFEMNKKKHIQLNKNERDLTAKPFV
jgi:hypothetical protein